MHQCFVCGNSSRYFPGISFHRIPKNLKKKKIWLRALNISNIDGDIRICSEHFLPEHIQTNSRGMRVLSINSVPRLNLPQITFPSCQDLLKTHFSSNLSASSNMNELVKHSNQTVSKVLPKHIQIHSRGIRLLPISSTLPIDVRRDIAPQPLEDPLKVDFTSDAHATSSGTTLLKHSNKTITGIRLVPISRLSRLYTSQGTFQPTEDPLKLDFSSNLPESSRKTALIKDSNKTVRSSKFNSIQIDSGGIKLLPSSSAPSLYVSQSTFKPSEDPLKEHSYSNVSRSTLGKDLNKIVTSFNLSKNNQINSGDIRLLPVSSVPPLQIFQGTSSSFEPSEDPLKLEVSSNVSDSSSRTTSIEDLDKIIEAARFFPEFILKNSGESPINSVPPLHTPQNFNNCSAFQTTADPLKLEVTSDSQDSERTLTASEGGLSENGGQWFLSNTNLNSTCTSSKETSRNRRREKMQWNTISPPPWKKRKHVLGRIEMNDFDTPTKSKKYFLITKRIVLKQRKQINTLRTSIQRLKKRVYCLKSVIKRLKKN